MGKSRLSQEQIDASEAKLAAWRADAERAAAEGTDPLTDEEIRLCLEGLSLRAYRMSPVGLIDSARAKLRARLGEAE